MAKVTINITVPGAPVYTGEATAASTASPPQQIAIPGGTTSDGGTAQRPLPPGSLGSPSSGGSPGGSPFGADARPLELDHVAAMTAGADTASRPPTPLPLDRLGRPGSGATTAAGPPRPRPLDQLGDRQGSATARRARSRAGSAQAGPTPQALQQLPSSGPVRSPSRTQRGSKK